MHYAGKGKAAIKFAKDIRELADKITESLD
jgi:hypothetical protein